MTNKVARTSIHYLLINLTRQSFSYRLRLVRFYSHLLGKLSSSSLMQLIFIFRLLTLGLAYGGVIASALPVRNDSWQYEDIDSIQLFARSMFPTLSRITKGGRISKTPVGKSTSTLDLPRQNHYVKTQDRLQSSQQSQNKPPSQLPSQLPTPGPRKLNKKRSQFQENKQDPPTTQESMKYAPGPLRKIASKIFGKPDGPDPSTQQGCSNCHVEALPCINIYPISIISSLPMSIHNTDTRERVEDLWFEDGNLILQAENSLFRVYSGILAARSSVFAGMITFPPPPEGNLMMDGCHIVFVYDSANDMTVFLKAIIDSSYFEPPPTHTELYIVEGVLRLSLKYDVQYLRRRALQHLTTTFPQTLKDWKQRDIVRTIPALDNTPFASLRIAREFDLTWLLPSILYCISSHPLEKTLDGVKWVEEDLELSWVDKRTALIGRAKILLLQSQNAVMMAKMAGIDIEGCTGVSCSSTRARCADVLGGWAMAGLLDYFEDNSDMYSAELCPTCRTLFQEHCASASHLMWNELPDMFELPGWTDLERFKALALE